MNPKEKAKELFDRLGVKLHCLIVCDEVLDYFPEMKIEKNSNYEWDCVPHEVHDYWTQVKKEIEKL